MMLSRFLSSPFFLVLTRRPQTKKGKRVSLRNLVMEPWKEPEP